MSLRPWWRELQLAASASAGGHASQRSCFYQCRSQQACNDHNCLGRSGYFGSIVKS